MKSLIRLALLAVAAYGTSAQADPLPKSKDSGDIQQGVHTDTGALSYAFRDGKYGGFHVAVCLDTVVDLGKLLSKKLTIEYGPVTSQEGIQSVIRGAVDRACGVTTNNATRQKNVAFGIPTCGEEVRVAVGTDSGIAASFALLTEGTADANVMDGQIVASSIFGSKNPAMFCLQDEVFSVESIAIMFRQEDVPFNAAVDGSIESMIKSGEIGKLYNTWFNSPIPPQQIKVGLLTLANIAGGTNPYISI